MHGSADRDETWFGRTNWLWLIVSGLSTGVWRLIGWTTRKWPRHLAPGGLGLLLVAAAAVVAALGLALSPEGMAGWLTAQAAGALLAAALVDLVVVTHAESRRRMRARQELGAVRVQRRPAGHAGRHRMMLVNDGVGPILDVRISVHVTTRGVTYRVFERSRVGASSSAEFDVINNEVATHLPFAPDDQLVGEWLDRRGDRHRREWRIGDHLFWGYPVAFEDDGGAGRARPGVRPVRSR